MLISNFRWKDFEPQLILDDAENKKQITFPMMNQKVSMKIGKRYCIGYSKKGKQFPCPESSEVSSERQCDLCRSLDHRMPCIQCSGICTNLSARRQCMDDNFMIYIAAFGSLLKVGISREYRIRQRLVEQGADFGAVISKVRDGRIVRVHEQNIRKFLQITDRLKGAEKHPHMYSESNECIESINKAIAKLQNSQFSKILTTMEIHDMRQYYNLVDVKSEMLPIREGAWIDGKVTSVKGSIALVENGSFKCIDCHALIGREVIVA